MRPSDTAIRGYLRVASFVFRSPLFGQSYFLIPEPLPGFAAAAGFGFSFLGFLGSRLLRFFPFAMLASPCRCASLPPRYSSAARSPPSSVPRQAYAIPFQESGASLAQCPLNFG